MAKRVPGGKRLSASFLRAVRNAVENDAPRAEARRLLVTTWNESLARSATMAWLSGDTMAESEGQGTSARSLVPALQRLRPGLSEVAALAQAAFPNIGRRALIRSAELRAFHDIKIAARDRDYARSLFDTPRSRSLSSRSRIAFEALEELLQAWERLRPFLATKGAWPLLPSHRVGWGTSRSVPSERAIPTRLAEWASAKGIDLKAAHAVLIEATATNKRPEGGFDAAVKRWTKALRSSSLDFRDRQERAMPADAHQAALVEQVTWWVHRGIDRLPSSEAASMAARLEAGDRGALVSLIELGRAPKSGSPLKEKDAAED